MEIAQQRPGVREGCLFTVDRERNGRGRRQVAGIAREAGGDRRRRRALIDHESARRLPRRIGHARTRLGAEREHSRRPDDRIVVGIGQPRPEVHGVVEVLREVSVVRDGRGPHAREARVLDVGPVLRALAEVVRRDTLDANLRSWNRQALRRCPPG